MNRSEEKPPSSEEPVGGGHQPHPRLILVRGGEVLQTIEMLPDIELTLGRTAQCDVVVSDGSVSRLHARLVRDASGVRLEDLGSANGSYVDARPVERHQQLVDGQHIRLGQKTVPDPVLIRFEAHPQPPHAAAEPAPQAGPPVPLGQSAPVEQPRPPATRPRRPPRMVPAGDSSEEQTVTSAAALGVAAPPRQRARWLVPAIAVGLLLVVAILVSLLALLHRSPTSPWRDVRLEPSTAQPGGSVALVSRDIDRLDGLRFLIDGEASEALEIQSGRAVLAIPERSQEIAGRYPLDLAVELGEVALFSGTLTVEVGPRIESLSPRELRVGDRLTVKGRALVDATGDVQAFIGDQPARVELATPTQLEVRIPAIAQQLPLETTLHIRAADHETTSAPLTVAPRQPRPLRFQFVAVPRGGVWEIRQPFGLAFRLDRGDDAAGSAPADVQEIADAFTNLFEEAIEDPDLAVVVRSGGGRYTLQSSRPGDRRATNLVRWTAADLASSAHPRDVVPELLADWIGVVTGHFLQVFSRGQSISDEPAEPYVEALNRLAQTNLESGGDGRPEMSDWEQLGLLDQKLIEEAFVDAARGIDSLAGRWHVQLSNAFYPEDEYEVHLLLDLAQRGRSLSGPATLTFGGSTIEFALPQSTARGRTLPGTPPSVHLEMTFNRPVETLRLDGTLGPDGMRGTFASAGTEGATERTWQATKLR